VSAGSEIRAAGARASGGQSGRTAPSPSLVETVGRSTEPCLHCGFGVPVRLMGCKGGHCPNCRHPYPHGDCSD